VKARPALAWPALALVALLSAACGSSSDDPDQATVDPDGGVLIETAETEYGPVLTDGDGHTLYLLITDRRDVPTCIEKCTGLWAPAIYSATLTAGPGIDPDLVGFVTREDGVNQFTYNRWPLYRYRGDARAGDIEGHGRLNVWFAMGAHGEAVGPTE